MKQKTTTWIAALSLSILSLSVVSCGISEGRAARSSQRASKAQQSVSKKRLKLIEQYKACIENAGGDKQKAEACDSYLKAAEALQ